MTEILDRLVEKINSPLYCEKEYKGIVASIIVSLGKDKFGEICEDKNEEGFLDDFSEKILLGDCIMRINDIKCK